jgi:hypothetical protein
MINLTEIYSEMLSEAPVPVEADVDYPREAVSMRLPEGITVNGSSLFEVWVPVFVDDADVDADVDVDFYPREAVLVRLPEGITVNGSSLFEVWE